jgi:hypothetical protein
MIASTIRTTTMMPTIPMPPVAAIIVPSFRHANLPQTGGTGDSAGHSRRRPANRVVAPQDLQAELDWFRAYYNEIGPHESGPSFAYIFRCQTRVSHSIPTVEAARIVREKEDSLGDPALRDSYRTRVRLSREILEAAPPSRAD